MANYSTSKIADSKAFSLSIWGTALLSVILALIFLCSEENLPHTLTESVYVSWIIGGINVTAIIFSCLLLARINRVHGIMQQRTRLPITLFLVFNCFNPDIIATYNTGLILTPIWLLMLYRLYDTYQGESQYAAYSIGLLSMAGCLLFPPFIYMAPLFITGCAYMRSINWRTIAACILGIFTIAWLIFCTYHIFDYTVPIDILARLKPSTFDYTTAHIDFIDLPYFIITAIIGLCCAVSGTYFISRYKIKIWLYNRFTVLLTISTLILASIDIHHVDNYLPVINAITAISASNFFIHTRNRYALWVFCIIILVHITLYIWNFWKNWGI